MLLPSLMLYGSRARGDSTPHSDVDLLAISSSPGKVGALTAWQLRVNIYPEAMLASMAEQGSLFVWHLRQEGRILLDLGGRLGRVLRRFRLRSDYEAERNEAAALGWLLLSPNAAPSAASLRIRTMVYCIRTIAISLLAERGEPAFSRSQVVALLPDEDLATLWSLKGQSILQPDHLHHLRRFLMRWAGPPPSWCGDELGSVPDADLPSEFVRQRRLQLERGLRQSRFPIDVS
jgi:Nucleotidyltransferase domain